MPAGSGPRAAAACRPRFTPHEVRFLRGVRCYQLLLCYWRLAIGGWSNGAFTHARTHVRTCAPPPAPRAPPLSPLPPLPPSPSPLPPPKHNISPTAFSSDNLFVPLFSPYRESPGSRGARNRGPVIRSFTERGAYHNWVGTSLYFPCKLSYTE
jgi:hypothetical protein